jgi:hypothetical protein
VTRAAWSQSAQKNANSPPPAVGDGGLEVGLGELPEVGEDVCRGERDAAAKVVGVDDGATAAGEGVNGEEKARGRRRGSRQRPTPEACAPRMRAL